MSLFASKPMPSRHSLENAASTRRPGRHALRRTIIGFVLLALLFGFGLWPLGCNSTEGTDFEIAYVDRDSLSRFDSIVVLLERNGASRPDTLFKGKLTNPEVLEHLPVPGDLSGKVTVSVKGFNKGELVFNRANEVDADAGKVNSTTLVATDKGKLRFDTTALRLKVGDTVDLPGLRIEPQEWSGKEVEYAFQEIKVLALLGKKKVVGLFRGTAKIIAFLKDAQHVSDTLLVQVVEPEAAKIAVTVTPDTLRLAAEGAAQVLKAETSPAYKPVTWWSADTSVATVDANGVVKGRSEGKIWVRARAVEDSTGADSAWVVVAPPVKVDSVRFAKRQIVLFVGGAADTVGLVVYPKDADPATDLKVLGKAVNLVNRRFIPVDTGMAQAVARSLKDTTKTDTLAIRVEKAQTLTAFKVTPDTLKLFLGGPGKPFEIAVEPASAGKSTVWRFAREGIAVANDTGFITALAEGSTSVEVLALADSGRRDTVTVQVIKDVPKLSVGNAIAVSPGKKVDFEPKVEQLFGGIVRFYYDLDGDGAWDDSSDGLKNVSRSYDATGEVVARFKVVDGEGNEAGAQRTVTITKGPLVEILEPVDGFVTKANTVVVNWQVDGVKQDKQTQESLTQDGPKTITRSAKDAAGNETVISITVFRDTKAPERPVVTGKSPTASKSPTFGWRGAGGGAGIFRYQIDGEPGDAQPTTQDTALTWPSDLSAGSHTLFVQERDTAGNWSASGQRRVVIDLIAPPAPTVQAVGGKSSTKAKVAFVWQGADEGERVYQYMLDKPVFDNTAITLGDTALTLTLGEGAHSLYVRQLDSAGNASASGRADVFVDTTGPGKPLVRSLTGAYSTSGKPTWLWKTGGGSGSGKFRSRLDTADLAAKPFATDTSFTPAGVLSEGPHTLFVQESDSLGNASPVESLTVTVDTQKPGAPACSEPADNAWVATRKPTWKWSRVAGGDGRFYAFIAGQYSPDTASRITDTALTSPVNLPDGLSTLGLKAYDAAGNASDLVTCRVRVDVTPPLPPTVASLAKFVNKTKPKRTFNASAANGASYRALLDNPDLTGGQTLPFAVLGEWMPTTDLAEGAHILYVQQLDSAGNASSAMADTFVVDVTAPAAPTLAVVQPTPSVTCAGATAGTLVRRSVQAGVAKVNYAFNDSTLGKPSSLDPAQTDIALPAGGCMAEGLNTLYVQEIDSAGNASPIARSGTIGAIREDVEPFKVSPVPTSPAIDFKIAGGEHFAAYLGASAAGITTAQVARRAGFGANWNNLDVSKIFLTTATDVRLAVDAANGQLAVANIGALAVQIGIYDGKAWTGVVMPPRQLKIGHAWFAMDFSSSGQLFVAFADGDYENGLTVCAVTKGECLPLTDDQGNSRGISKTPVSHVFLTAKPSLLVAARTVKPALPLVYGLQSDGLGGSLLSLVKTGMEEVTTEHFGFGVVKNTVELMYFAGNVAPTLQALQFSPKQGVGWSAEQPVTLPKEVGTGLGVMDVGPNGRPYVALPKTGQIWGLDNGAWKTVRTFKLDFTTVSGIDLKVGGDGLPYVIASPAAPDHLVFRLGFDLPHTVLKQP